MSTVPDSLRVSAQEDMGIQCVARTSTTVLECRATMAPPVLISIRVSNASVPQVRTMFS